MRPSRYSAFGIRAADRHERDANAISPGDELIEPTIAACLSPGHAAADNDRGDNHGDADQLRRRQYSRESAGEAAGGEQEAEREQRHDADDRAIAEYGLAIGVRFDGRRHGVGRHADTIPRASIATYINK
jgi:hypothetical protein